LESIFDPFFTPSSRKGARALLADIKGNISEIFGQNVEMALFGLGERQFTQDEDGQGAEFPANALLMSASTPRGSVLHRPALYYEFTQRAPRKLMKYKG